MGRLSAVLGSMAAAVQVPLSRTIAIGDGANDLPMLEVAGLSVGYLPKDAVRPACDAVVASMSELGALLESHNVIRRHET